MFAHFTHHVSNSLLTPLLPVIRDSLSLSYTHSGFLVSAFTVSQGFSQAPIGMLADRFTSRTVIILGLFATALCMALVGLAGEYWQLLLVLICMGVVAGSYHAPAATALAQAFRKESLGGALGLHTMGGNFSFFATPLVAGGLVAITQTWRSPYLAFALAPALAALLLLAITPQHTDEAAGTRRQGVGILRDLLGVFRVVGPLLTAVILFQLVYAAMSSLLALYLVDVRGFAPATAVFIVAIPSMGSLIGGPLGGALSDRLGRRPVILISLGCLGPLLWLLVVVPEFAMFPVLLLMGLFASMRMPVVEGLLLDRAPVDRRATILGSYYLVAQELGGLGAPALGGLATLFGISAAFTAVGITAALFSALILLVRARL